MRQASSPEIPGAEPSADFSGTEQEREKEKEKEHGETIKGPPPGGA